MLKLQLIDGRLVSAESGLRTCEARNTCFDVWHALISLVAVAA